MKRPSELQDFVRFVGLFIIPILVGIGLWGLVGMLIAVIIWVAAVLIDVFVFNGTFEFFKISVCLLTAVGIWMVFSQPPAWSFLAILALDAAYVSIIYIFG